MQSFNAFRLTAHTLFYSLIVCMFSPFRESWAVFAVLAALTLPVTLVATNCASPLMRLLLGLIPAVSMLLPVTGPLVYIAAGVCVVYVAGFLAIGRFHLEVWRYRPEVILMLILCPFLLWFAATELCMSFPSRMMALVCMVLSVLALRALRLGRAPTAGWQAGNVGFYLLPFLGAGAVTLLLKLIAPVFEFLVGGIGKGFGYLLILWNNFWNGLMQKADVAEDLAETEDAVAFYSQAAGQEASAAEVTGRVRLFSAEIPWAYLLLLLVGVAVILLVLWLIWRGRPPVGKKRADDTEGEGIDPKEDRSRRRRKKRAATLTDAERIRSLYQEYLHFLSRNGVYPRQSSTTADITDASAAILLETDELLRVLYRKARYSNASFTAEEVEAARNALDRLTREENLIKPDRTQGQP